MVVHPFHAPEVVLMYFCPIVMAVHAPVNRQKSQGNQLVLPIHQDNGQHSAFYILPHTPCSIRKITKSQIPSTINKSTYIVMLFLAYCWSRLKKLNRAPNMVWVDKAPAVNWEGLLNRQNFE